MKQSTDRILTTHTGSLPRPMDLAGMLEAKDAGAPLDAEAFGARVRGGGGRGGAAAGGGGGRRHQRRRAEQGWGTPPTYDTG